MQSFSTLDAVDLGSQFDTETVSTAAIRSGRVQPCGVVHYSVTKPSIDPRSQRHSRTLISEAAVPTKQATLFIQGGENIKHKISLYNYGRRNSNVKLASLDQTGKVQRE